MQISPIKYICSLLYYGCYWAIKGQKFCEFGKILAEFWHSRVQKRWEINLRDFFREDCSNRSGKITSRSPPWRYFGLLQIIIVTSTCTVYTDKHLEAPFIGFWIWYHGDANHNAIVPGWRFTCIYCPVNLITATTTYAIWHAMWPLCKDGHHDSLCIYCHHACDINKILPFPKYCWANVRHAFNSDQIY